MGLRDTFKNAGTAIFNAFGDVPASCTFKSVSSTVYDASAGASSTLYAKSVVAKVVLVDYSYRELAAIQNIGSQSNLPTNVRPNDRKGMILYNALGSTVTPKPDDVVTISGDDWKVMGVKTDPAEAVWTLQLRKSG